jgi:hypothetical protein
MGFHPVNLTFRFLLEIAGLVGLFRLGLDTGTGCLALGSRIRLHLRRDGPVGDIPRSG